MPTDMKQVKDHGYAWIVLGAAFSIQFILGSVFLGFSVLLVELPEIFRTNKATTSWIGSIMAGTSAISGIDFVFIL